MLKYNKCSLIFLTKLQCRQKEPARETPGKRRKTMEEINEEIEGGNELNPNLKVFRTSDFRVVSTKYLIPPDNRSPKEKQKIIKKYTEKAEKGLPLFEES